jgi:hypothetical protein
MCNDRSKPFFKGTVTQERELQHVKCNDRSNPFLKGTVKQERVAGIWVSDRLRSEEKLNSYLLNVLVHAYLEILSLL